MGRIEDASQPLSTHVSVYLRGSEVGVAKQFLYRPKIGAPIQQVGCEGVSERVWMRRHWRAVIEYPANIPWRERSPSAIHEQRLVH